MRAPHSRSDLRLSIKRKEDPRPILVPLEQEFIEPAVPSFFAVLTVWFIILLWSSILQEMTSAGDYALIVRATPDGDGVVISANCLSS